MYTQSNIDEEAVRDIELHQEYWAEHDDRMADFEEDV